MIPLVFQMAGLDHRGFGVSDLPGDGLFFVLFHRNASLFLLFCTANARLCFTEEPTEEISGLVRTGRGFLEFVISFLGKLWYTYNKKMQIKEELL